MDGFVTTTDHKLTIRAELGVGTDEGPLIVLGGLQYYLIVGIPEAEIRNVDDISSGVRQGRGETRREIVVQQQPHADGRSGSCRSRTASAA